MAASKENFDRYQKVLGFDPRESKDELKITIDAELFGVEDIQLIRSYMNKVKEVYIKKSFKKY